MSKTQLAKALELAKRGFYVFPLDYKLKTPKWNGWEASATTDPAEIERMFKGKSSNIGIATGPSGLLVVDIDVKKGDGLANFKEFKGENDLPPTLMAKTPSGGTHLIYKGISASSVGRVCEHVDIRSVGGLVVAPGSKVEIGDYVFANDNDVAEAPDWLVHACGKPREARGRMDVDPELMDLPDQIDRATAYLEQVEPAIEGHGGDFHTVRVASRVMDFGVSPDLTFDLMDLLWNPRCEPPWDKEELERKVGNAAMYRQEPIGCDSPEADFEILEEEIDEETEEEEDDGSVFDQISAVKPFNSNIIPKRHWLWGRYLLKGYVTSIVAAPGVGKSTKAFAIALATITGRKDITGVEVHERGAVVLVNNEDDDNELARRLSAAMDYWDISWQEIEGKLFIWSADKKTWKIATREKLMDPLKPAVGPNDIAWLKQNNIVLFIADPFLETHEANENDNREINFVGQVYRWMAKKANCAVLLIHHTRKLSGNERTSDIAGNMELARGAGSLVGVVRVGLTMFEMTKKDAEFYGIPEEQASHYVRLDHGKANLSKKTAAAHWYEKTEVVLNNGDDVGVLVPTKLQSAEVTEREAMVELFINRFEENQQAYVYVTEAAKWLDDDPLLSSIATRQRAKRIRDIFKTPATAHGWSFEIEEEAKGQTKRYRLCAYPDCEADDA